MNQYIKRLVAVGLHGRFDIDISFSEGINIVYGINGAGKTTLLHLLSNTANLDIERFSTLIFRTITLEMANGTTFRLDREFGEDLGHHNRVSLRINGELVSELPDTNVGSRREMIQRRREVESILESERIETTYFPAFRNLGEAWSSFNLSELAQSGFLNRRMTPNRSRLNQHRRLQEDLGVPLADSHTQPLQTELARGVFGEFVPFINYPSPRDIQRQLDSAIQRAVNRLASDDRSLLSDVFRQVFEAVSREGPDTQDSRTPEEIRDQIGRQLKNLQSTQNAYGIPDSSSAFGDLQSQLELSKIREQESDDTTTRVLRVYETALNQRDENLRTAFASVRNFIDAVNHFLDGKQLVTASTPESDSTLRLYVFHDDGTYSQLDTLSSGERQIAGLIYSATHIAQGAVVLVDEPELSLHIDWQRAIIGAMVQQFPSKQLIVCTHSPVIGTEYDDQMIELIPKPTSGEFFSPEVHVYEEEFFLNTDDFEEVE